MWYGAKQQQQTKNINFYLPIYANDLRLKDLTVSNFIQNVYIKIFFVAIIIVQKLLPLRLGDLSETKSTKLANKIIVKVQ